MHEEQRQVGLGAAVLGEHGGSLVGLPVEQLVRDGRPAEDVAKLVRPPRLRLADDRHGDLLGRLVALPVGERLGDRQVEPRLPLRPRHEDVRVDVPQDHGLPHRVTTPSRAVDEEQPASLGMTTPHVRQQVHSPDAGLRQVGRCQDQGHVPARVGQRVQLVPRPRRGASEHVVVRRETAPEVVRKSGPHRGVVDGDEDDRNRHGQTLTTDCTLLRGLQRGLVPDTVSGPTVSGPCWESESSPAAAGSACACSGTTTRWGCSPRRTSTSGPDGGRTRCRSSRDSTGSWCSKSWASRCSR